MPTGKVNSIGEEKTGAVRVRPGWFGFAIVEEQIEDVFGTRFWRRIDAPMLLKHGLGFEARTITTLLSEAERRT